MTEVSSPPIVNQGKRCPTTNEKTPDLLLGAIQREESRQRPGRLNADTGIGYRLLDH